MTGAKLLVCDTCGATISAHTTTPQCPRVAPVEYLETNDPMEQLINPHNELPGP